MKKALALLLSLVLAISAVKGVLLCVSYADPTFEIDTPLEVSLLSPENNQTFSANNVSVTFTINLFDVPFAPALVKYSLDDGLQEDIPLGTYQPFSFTLTGLPEGRHSIQITAIPPGGTGTFINHITHKYTIGHSGNVFFTVDTVPIVVSIMSPKNNKTYNTNFVPLNFVISEPASLIEYNLDGQANMIINGNTTLPELPYGSHNMSLYATDNAGNFGASETVLFTVVPEEPTSEPFPTTYSMGFVAVIVLVLLGAIVYVLKRKR